MKMMLESKPKAVLIATFGTIARADVMAEGIAKAVKELKPSIPIVTVIRGTGEEEAIEMLKDAGLEPLSDTEDAVNKVLALVGGGAK
jgi:succinyl-CoA synthetase beta subunit